jgi:hypothetical protein
MINQKRIQECKVDENKISALIEIALQNPIPEPDLAKLRLHDN